MLLDYTTIDISHIKSKLLNEFFEAKKNSKDAILLFQVGDFFETYFSDAKKFSEITGTVLTARHIKEVGRIAMSGVHKNQVQNYIKMLLDAGEKVSFSEQYLESNGKFSRKISRIYTTGTIIEQEFLDCSENNYLLALNIMDGMHQIAYADVSTGQFYKTSGSREEIVLEIEKISPTELLILSDIRTSFEQLCERYNTTFITLQQYGEVPEQIIINYCKEMQKDFFPKMDKIVEYNINTYLTMDEITRRNLEITRTKRFLKKKGSIIWFLNHTKTPMGMRFLKKIIDEPLIDIAEIEKRQDALQKFIDNQDALCKIEENLQNFNDLSRMCARILNATILPKDLYRLASDVKILENLKDVCLKIQNPLINIDKDNLKNVLKMADKIIRALSDESSNELKSGGIINDGYNANLDYLRSCLNEVKFEILAYEKKEKNKYSLKNFKIEYSRTIGYYIEVPKSKKTVLSKDYIRKQELANCIRYSTDVLHKLESRVFELQFKINELEYELFCEIRKMALEFTLNIRELAKSIAQIDVLASLSRCAIENNFIRPKFNNEHIEIKNGFHPSLLKLNNEIVKNDTYLKNHSMMVLTGANMSGKSTYLKYNAIICLLSQIGSFIPADSANMTIVDKIFLRQGSTDDIINNNSSFMVEMIDLKFILDNATKHSLVLLDEPAKSTNAHEGGAIARAYCEYLLENIKPKLILATHNLELTKLEDDYPTHVMNYVIGKTDVSQVVVADRKLKRGVIDSSLAINTAILADLPEKIIATAQNYIGVS